MIMRFLLLIISSLLIFSPQSVLAASSGAALQDDDVLTVGTRVVPPFVIDNEDGTYSGITIDLMDHIAGELGFEYELEETGLNELITGLEDGSFDISAAALTITAEREQSVDFSHPFYVTGLGIAVPYTSSGWWGAMKALFSGQFWWVTFLLVALLMFWGVLVWLFERYENKEEFGGSAAEGIGSGFWWAAVTMTTVGYGDKSPVTLGGRVVGFVWMFAAIILISFFTASIASSLTVSQLDSNVRGPGDLPNVRTGVLSGSATESWMQENRISYVSFDTIDDGFNALASERLDAFVHDAPIIRYIAKQDFSSDVMVLPNTFNEQYYGLAVPLGSPLRAEINLVLLDLLADPEWDDNIRNYLGN